MSYLSNFYNTVTQIGLSKDYQLKMVGLYLNKESTNFCDKWNLRAYTKKISLPTLKSQVQANLNLSGVVQPVFGGVADYVDKSNFPVTFWLDSNLQIYEFFMSQINVDKSATLASTLPSKENVENAKNLLALSNAEKREAAADTTKVPEYQKMILHVINDAYIPVYEITLTKLSIVGVNAVQYSSDGTGKPQELTVTFSYDLAQRKAITEEKRDYYYQTNTYGSTDNGKVAQNDELEDMSTFKLNKRPFPDQFTIQKPQGVVGTPKGGLAGFLAGLKATTQTIQAIGGAAGSIRGATRSIRGR